MSRYVNILKLCVGVDEVSELVAWQRRRLDERRRAKQPLELYHRTRQVPKRADEVVAGGSLYWIIKGFVRVRQRIIRIDLLDPPIDTKRCAFILEPELVRTELQARRPHQGWRYLDPKDAPGDLPGGMEPADDLPAELVAELRGLGLI
jgi:hypothetical protein